MTAAYAVQCADGVVSVRIYPTPEAALEVVVDLDRSGGITCGPHQVVVPDPAMTDGQRRRAKKHWAWVRMEVAVDASP